jgi:ABC-type transporter Mla MlaB component
MTEYGDADVAWKNVAPDFRVSSAARGSAMLEIELVPQSTGCTARFFGDLVAGTCTALWGAESVLLHESHVTMDLSGITSMDSAGLEAALSLMDAVRHRGGMVKVGRSHGSDDEMHQPIAGRSRIAGLEVCGYCESRIVHRVNRKR